MKRSSPASHISVQSASHQRFESAFESRTKAVGGKMAGRKISPGFGDLRGGPALDALQHHPAGSRVALRHRMSWAVPLFPVPGLERPGYGTFVAPRLPHRFSNTAQGPAVSVPCYLRRAEAVGGAKPWMTSNTPRCSCTTFRQRTNGTRRSASLPTDGTFLEGDFEMMLSSGRDILLPKQNLNRYHRRNLQRPCNRQDTPSSRSLF